MRKLLLVLMLIIMSGSATAKWTEAGRSKDLIVYYDPATIRKSGSKAIIWSLHDYKIARGQVEYRSVTLESEYDCVKKQSRRLFLSFYQKNMGAGTTIRKYTDPSNWLPISMGSIKESMWRNVCLK